jgi:hypothetical protein
MTTQKTDRPQTDRPQRSADSRYQQLVTLAHEGNKDAEGDLFREYGVVINPEGSSHDAD